MTPEELAALAESVRGLPPLRALAVRTEDVDAEARTVVSVISTGELDRYETIIEPRGARLDDYRRNPVVLFNHQCERPPLGRALWVKVEKAKNRILAKTAFDSDPFSSELFEKVRSETLRAWSIRFEPDWSKCGPPTDEEMKADKRYKAARYVFRSWGLLEYSLVTIPGNADCLTLPEGRGLELPADLARVIEDLAVAPTLELEAPGTGPLLQGLRSDEPGPPALPPLDGARSFDQVLRDLTDPITRASLTAEARRLVDSAIGRARGRI